MDKDTSKEEKKNPNLKNDPPSLLNPTLTPPQQQTQTKISSSQTNIPFEENYK